MPELAAVLAEIEDADTDYDRRYGLVLRALAVADRAGHKAGFRIDPTEPAWPVAYIELPTGQVSWHMPQHLREWDGHTTEAKYERCRAYASRLRTRPTITVLCGSTRFGDAFRDANLRLTVAGHIVLSIGCDMRSDNDLWSDIDEAARIKAELDELHKRKIDLADEVFVLNVGGYIGESTRSEIEYAEQLGKPVSYLITLPCDGPDVRTSAGCRRG